MKKILIDARLSGLKNTGIGRYVENLIANLPGEKEVEVKVIDANSARFHPYTILSQLEMLFILIKEKPDLVHIPHFTIPVFWPGKMVITIHDLIKHESRGPKTSTRDPLVYWLKYLGYLAIVKIALFRAKHILVPAKYWKDKLISQFSVPEKKISVTYEGVSKVFFHPTGPKLEVAKPYIIYAGSLYPHKNVITILNAVKILNGKINFYISCARDVFASRLGSHPWVTYLGFVDDRELSGLYNQSIAFVTASKIEGFGLPGLEAMAAGTAVISSNSTVFPEIYGDAAIYFDPDNPNQLADKIENLLKDKKLRKDLIAKGKSRVKKYSWSKMARETWEIYQKYI